MTTTIAAPLPAVRVQKLPQVIPPPTPLPALQRVGPAGARPELRLSDSDVVQWRWEGQTAWTDLFSLADIEGGATNLSIANRNDATLDVASDTGNDATLPAATTSLAGLLTAADKTKLDGIAAGATANATDSALRDRANHTGEQAIGTVTGLQDALDGKAAQATTYTKTQADAALAQRSTTGAAFMLARNLYFGG